MTKPPIEMVQRIYMATPGHERVPTEYRDGEEVRLWGEVENTPEWEFAETIATEIINAAQAYSR